MCVCVCVYVCVCVCDHFENSFANLQPHQWLLYVDGFLQTAPGERRQTIKSDKHITLRASRLLHESRVHLIDCCRQVTADRVRLMAPLAQYPFRTELFGRGEDGSVDDNKQGKQGCRCVNETKGLRFILSRPDHKQQQ